ncbi:Ubiquitin-protein ligase [Pleosporales sp. CAS-2024a]
MSAPEFCPHWNPATTSTMTQDSEATAPRFDAYAGPFAQPHHDGHDAYRQFNGFAANPSLEHAPIANQTFIQLPNPYEQSHPAAFEYQNSYSGARPHMAQPPVPRRPVFSSNRPGETHPDMAWYSGAGHMPALPNHTMVQGSSISPLLYPQRNDVNFLTPHPFWHFGQAPRLGVMDQQLPGQYPAGYASGTTPVRTNSERSRPSQSTGRRWAQQGPRPYHNNNHNRSQDLAERRAFRSANNAQARQPDGNEAPLLAGRRPYDSFIHEMSRSMGSSEADEAASRIPPSYRARRIPREHRMRQPTHSQHQDGNLATSRQIQELKDKLPRRLGCQLPEGASQTCDICAKEYSSTRVPPSEDDEIAIELPCGHWFGEFCIFEWFDTCKKHKNKVSCPMCRKQLIEAPSRLHTALLFNVMAQGRDAALQDLLASELRGDLGQA